MTQKAHCPQRFAACKQHEPDAIEHALAGEETLCGISEKNVSVFRHLWYPNAEKACDACIAAFPYDISWYLEVTQ